MMPESVDRTRQGRGYGQACVQCRQRKRRCESTGRNSCQSCDKEGVHCQQFRQKSQRRNPNTSRSPGSTAPTSTPWRNSDGNNISESNDRTFHGRPHHRVASSSGSASGWQDLLSHGNEHIPTAIRHGFSEDISFLDSSFSGPPIIIDNSATLPLLQDSEAHNSRAFQDGKKMQTSLNDDPRIPGDITDEPSAEYNAAMSRFVSSVCGEISDLTIEEDLLSKFFTWQAGQNNTVSERLFRRDMNRRPYGPYFSPALLFVLYAQATRVTQAFSQGRKFAGQAQALCLASLSDRPSLPNTQALLELGGRELAMGNGSNGWMFCGMAIRMVIDMDLQSDVHRHVDESLNAEERDQLEVRIRVFWSAFCWDKFFALTMGRQPTLAFPRSTNKHALFPSLDQLRAHHSSSTQSIALGSGPVVNAGSSELWQPLWLEGQEAISYTPQATLAAESFQAACLLFAVIDDIIRGLYHPSDPEADPTTRETWTMDITDKLIAWRAMVAPSILLDTAYLPSQSPPPHILATNILYRTAWILLKRPLRVAQDVDAEVEANQSLCAARSAEIHALFRLHERSFGLRNLTYFMAYMAYVSATVDVMEAYSADPNRVQMATARLTFTIQILTHAAILTPGIRRSITQLRRRIASQSSNTSNTDNLAATTAHPSSLTRSTSPSRDGQLPQELSVVPAQQSGPQTMDLLQDLLDGLMPESRGQPEWSMGSTNVLDSNYLTTDNDVWDWFTTQ